MKVDDPRVLRAAAAIVALLDAFALPGVRGAAAMHYTSNKGGPRPSGKSVRWCRDTFRHIPGARKEGRDWVIPIVAYERWAEARTTQRSVKLAAAAPVKPAAAAWSPEAALAQAGLRAQRVRGAS